MEIHGFDDPTSDVHSMYTPDTHTAVADTGTDGLDHDTGYDPVDHTDSAGTETIEIDVDGRTTDVTATVDTDHDGRADTAVLDPGDGNRVAITDSDHDGRADHALLIDSEGRVVDSAAYDESTGRWHDDGLADSSHAPGGPSSGDTAEPGDSAGPTGGGTTSQQIEFDAGERSEVLEATVDTDHDGRGDTAIADAGDGTRIAVTDTDHDGRADEAALLDGTGHVLDTAHIDPTTGEWVQGSDSHTPYGVGEAFPGADGATTTAGTGTADTSTSTGSGDTATTTAADSGPSHGEDRQITVEAAGRSSEVQATVDTDHDGVNDTAVVQGPDGSQVALSDTDGDGEADRAVLFDAQGNVVSTAHYDPSTGDWVDDRR
jgi:hypothetical protein